MGNQDLDITEEDPSITEVTRTPPSSVFFLLTRLSEPKSSCQDPGGQDRGQTSASLAADGSLELRIMGFSWNGPYIWFELGLWLRGDETLNSGPETSSDTHN